MFCPYLDMLLLLIPLTHLPHHPHGAVAENCKIEICNYESACERPEGGNRPACQCLGSKYFTGEFCAQQVDNCSPNPCQNGAICSNALGQAVCGPCPAGFAGHLCDIPVQEDLFSKMYLHHNRFGFYAAQQQFLFTVEHLGTSEFILEFLTDNYVIEILKVHPGKLKGWTKSSDLAAIARRLDLRHDDKMPYRSGYYHVAKGRFWQIGIQNLRLKVFSGDSLRSFVELEFTMEISKGRYSCIPKIDLVHCSDPFNPLQLDVAHYSSVSLIVLERCLASSSMNFQWKIYNSYEGELFHDYGSTDSPRLKIPPYPDWARRRQDVMQTFLIRIGITEQQGDESIYMISRCYVFITSKPVIAKILGGNQRELLFAKGPIRLDGSQSQDLAQPPAKASKLTYTWNCQSDDDPDNKFCKLSLSKAKIVEIPSGTLKQDASYRFTLQVQSQINEFSLDQAMQTLKLSATKRPLYVDLKCVRNCEANRFAPNRMLHLKAECIRCNSDHPSSSSSSSSSSSLAYTWTMNGEVSAIKTKRFILPEGSNAADLTVRVEVESEGNRGAAVIQLKSNPPPSGGRCSIQPTTGIEFETEFEISCPNYDDDDQPLLYEIATEVLTLERTSDSRTRLSLPQTQQIQIAICDSFGSCAIERLPVNVAALTMPHDVSAFLNRDETNLRTLLRNGNFQRAIVLALAVTNNAEAVMNSAGSISQKLKQFKRMTLIEVEQFISILLNMCESFRPLDHYAARSLSTLFEVLAEGFINVITDGEIRELMLPAYRAMSEKIASIYETLSQPAEHIPRIHSDEEDYHVNTNSRIEENYPPLEEMNSNLLQRMNSWVDCSIQLNRCLKFLGFLASLLHEPSEPPSIVESERVAFEVFTIEEMEMRNIKPKHPILTMTLTSPILRELYRRFESDRVTLQLISLPGSSPFWWYSDGRSLATGIFYCSAFNRKMTIRNLWGIALSNTFELSFNLQELTLNNKNNNLAHGYLKDDADMNIFRMSLPANTLLVLRFAFNSIKLRISLQPYRQPTGYRVRRNNSIVSEQFANRSVLLLNDQAEDIVVYLAVIPAESVNSNEGEVGASFSFDPVLRQCLSWDFELENPQWTTRHCKPIVKEDIGVSLTCHCHHLSIYSGRITTTRAYSLFGVGDLLEDLPVNWLLISYLFALGFIFLFWIFIAYLRLDPNRECLVTTAKDSSLLTTFRPRSSADSDVVVRLTTGGQRNATTTSGIIIALLTVKGPQRFKIYQNPNRLLLKQNTTCTVRLPMDVRKLEHPITLLIRHDGGGRYPTWYCRSLEIHYKGARWPIELLVDNWITGNVTNVTARDLSYMQEHHVPSQTQPPSQRTKNQMFNNSLESLFINWFHIQPLFGPWKYGRETLNRFERSLVWIAKAMVSITIISCYFGWTLPVNYEEERIRYRRPSIGWPQLLLLSIVCFLIGSAIQMAMEYYLFRPSRRSLEFSV